VLFFLTKRSFYYGRRQFFLSMGNGVKLYERNSDEVI
jgi:hypothetical protein